VPADRERLGLTFPKTAKAGHPRTTPLKPKSGLECARPGLNGLRSHARARRGNMSSKDYFSR